MFGEAKEVMDGLRLEEAQKLILRIINSGMKITMLSLEFRMERTMI